MSRTFRLATEEKRELLLILRRHKADGLVVRRTNALILLDDGKSSLAIADFLYLDVGTVRAWRRSFETDGLSSLAIAGYSKREGYLSFEQEAELQVQLIAHPMRTSLEIRAHIEHTYGRNIPN